jgi:signal transduction histidine kinase
VVNNKSRGDFNEDDIELLSSIAGLVSLPLENARINDALGNSYDEIKALNRAKDRIIDHLSHELRTPLSVLSASLSMLTGEHCPDPRTAARILARSRRNLNRIVEMQSKIADITRNPYQRIHRTLQALLSLCTDELESLADVEIGPYAAERIRKRIDEYFEPQSTEILQLDLVPFVRAELENLRPQFAHRRIHFSADIIDQAIEVRMPEDVLTKIITGLVRNAVEYTPDGGEVTVTVRNQDNGPELVVADTGVGITGENQKLIFDNYFTTADIGNYRTGAPYDFNAGGSGFDLLRMQVFAERYHFKILMHSKRCPHIPTNEDRCPGSTDVCSHCDFPEHCRQSGGTRFTIRFSDAMPQPAGISNRREDCFDGSTL